MTAHQNRKALTLEQRQQNRSKAKAAPKRNYYELAKYESLRYDYALIAEADREQVQRAAVEILAHGKRAKESITGMGQRLIDVKAILPDETFTAWIETEFELSIRMAQNLMNVARQYGERHEIISCLNDTVLYLLSAPSTPQSARDEVENIAIAEGKSPKVARVQRVIKAHKTPEIISPVLDPAHPSDEEAQAMAEVEAEHSIEERLRLAMNFSRDEQLTFAQWLALMPADLGLREQLAILALAKTTALHALGDHPKLYNAVYGALPTWSQLITTIEKDLKHE